MDPVVDRPLGVSTIAVGGLAMRRYLHLSGRSQDEGVEVARTNREHARWNPRASSTDVNDPEPVFEPLTREQISTAVDGCVVMVLAAEGRTGDRTVWIDGVGWASDSPTLESRDWGRAAYAEQAAEQAYRRAGVAADEVDVAEVDDTFAYKQLQHLDALGLSRLDPNRVNRSGGALGEGYLHEA